MPAGGAGSILAPEGTKFGFPSTVGLSSMGTAGKTSCLRARNGMLSAVEEPAVSAILESTVPALQDVVLRVPRKLGREDVSDSAQPLCPTRL